MKGTRNPPPAPAPSSSLTAKIASKDGSKVITIPKTSAPAIDSTQPTPQPSQQPAQTPESAPAPAPTQSVNRKKQKRRAKAAAKAAKAAAAEQARSQEQQPPSTNGAYVAQEEQEPKPGDQPAPGAGEPEGEEDGRNQNETLQDQQDQQGQQAQQNGTSKSKKKKKKKKKDKDAAGQNDNSGNPSSSKSSGMSREKIWNTSSQEERERIKEFWLGLSEAERKSLVKVEKDAVLKKMKEQQKHTCSCTVCGRKRTAIEEELEGLYDAYYEELEQYANHPNQGEGPPMLRPRRSYSSMRGTRSRGLTARYTNHQPSHGRIVEQLGDGEDEEADYDDDGGGDGEADDFYSDGELEEDVYSDEEPSELHRSDYAADFFNFGNSLTVQGRDRLPILPSFLECYPFSGAGNNAYGSPCLGGILTVADDLLKNDGKKFIEMMEQLAERRMAREEDAREQFERGYDHANGDRYGHGHPAPPDDDDYDDEEEDYEEDEEDDYDSQEEEVCSWHLYALLATDQSRLNPLTFGLGHHDRGATHGGRPKNVSNFRCSDVRAKSTDSLS